ncbi:MAG: Gfo/Idh/MocA family oxidoreductase, partial [Caldilineaceae bacterium]|nr:Gfo/Idh/MocA family oxidoreductase [Caldilineaceae bacterium]
MTKLRGGIFGFGNIGQNVAQYINGRQHAEAQIVAICDVDAAQLQLAREQYGLHATPDMSELAQMDLDFVVVASPNAVHAAQVTAAAAAGKHIFCEKPVDLSIDRVRRCLDVVDQTGATLMVGFN